MAKDWSQLAKRYVFTGAIVLLGLLSCSSCGDAKSEVMTQDALYPVSLGNKWGYSDEKGVLRIPARFDLAGPFDGNIAIVWIKTSWTSLIVSGRVYKYGCIDKRGHFVVEPSFYYLGRFSDGLALARGVGRFGGERGSGYVDRTFTFVIGPGFASANGFSEGLAAVRREGGKYGYIDVKGASVIEPGFDEAWGFSEGLACVKKGAFWGFIDRTGAWVVTPQFDLAYSFSCGLAPVRRDSMGKFGYIDKRGDWCIPPAFYYAHEFKEGLARVETDDSRSGFIDKTGAWRIEPKYHLAADFSEGKASVTREEGAFYIDSLGKEVLGPFDNAASFSGGVARVNEEYQNKEIGPFSLIDHKGNFVWDKAKSK